MVGLYERSSREWWAGASRRIAVLSHTGALQRPPFDSRRNQPGGQQEQGNEPAAQAEDALAFHEGHHFPHAGLLCVLQDGEVRQSSHVIRRCPARNFADDKGMRDNEVALQQID